MQILRYSNSSFHVVNRTFSSWKSSTRYIPTLSTKRHIMFECTNVNKGLLAAGINASRCGGLARLSTGVQPKEVVAAPKGVVYTVPKKVSCEDFYLNNLPICYYNNKLPLHR